MVSRSEAARSGGYPSPVFCEKSLEVIENKGWRSQEQEEGKESATCRKYWSYGTPMTPIDGTGTRPVIKIRAIL
jgi:hypothetical protein